MLIPSEGETAAQWCFYSLEADKTRYNMSFKHEYSTARSWTYHGYSDSKVHSGKNVATGPQNLEAKMSYYVFDRRNAVRRERKKDYFVKQV